MAGNWKIWAFPLLAASSSSQSSQDDSSSQTSLDIPKTVGCFAGGGILQAGWQQNRRVYGRYFDSPETLTTGTDGVFTIDYEDTLDGWVIECEFSAAIGNHIAPGATDPPFKPEDPLYPPIQPIDPSLPPGTPGGPPVTEVCTCTIVCDVICADGIHVSEVCYCTISFPKSSLLDCSESCGTLDCVPCGTTTPDESSASSSSSMTTTTLSSLSTSSTLSSSSSISATSLSTVSTLSTSSISDFSSPTTQSTLSTLTSQSTQSTSSRSSSVSTVSSSMSTTTLSTPSSSTISFTTTSESSTSVTSSEKEKGATQFDGSAYLQGHPGGVNLNSEFGSVSMWFTIDDLFGEDDVRTLLAFNTGDVPRLEFGVMEEGGAPVFYIESDDGGPPSTALGDTGAKIFTADPGAVGLNPADGALHHVRFAVRPVPAGAEYFVELDGVEIPDITLDPFTNEGRWFKTLQDRGGNFAKAVMGAFDHQPGVDQFWIGGIDEALITDGVVPPGSIGPLYETQPKIPEIETNYPTIWSQVTHAFELTAAGTKEIGREYITGNQAWFSQLHNVTPRQEGIRGILQVAADMVSTPGQETGLVATHDATMLHSGTIGLVVWVRFDDATAAANEYVVAKQTGTLEWALFRAASDNRLHFQARLDNGTTVEATSTGTVNNDRAYFVAVRLDRTWGHLQLIIGDDVGSALNYGPKITVANKLGSTTSNVEFGMGSNANHMDGALDDVLVIHDLLQDVDVVYLYSSGEGKAERVAYHENNALWQRMKQHWNFNEDSGTRVNALTTAHAQVAVGKQDPGSRPGVILD